jgi:hypothetical protein
MDSLYTDLFFVVSLGELSLTKNTLVVYVIMQYLWCIHVFFVVSLGELLLLRTQCKIRSFPKKIRFASYTEDLLNNLLCFVVRKSLFSFAWCGVSEDTPPTKQWRSRDEHQCPLAWVFVIHTKRYKVVESTAVNGAGTHSARSPHTNIRGAGQKHTPHTNPPLGAGQNPLLPIGGGAKNTPHTNPQGVCAAPTIQWNAFDIGFLISGNPYIVKT